MNDQTKGLIGAVVLIALVLMVLVAVAIFVFSMIGLAGILACIAIPAALWLIVKASSWSFAILNLGRSFLINLGVQRP